MGFFRQLNIFGGMKILWIFFFFWGGGGGWVGPLKNWTIFRGDFSAFFLGCYTFKYLFGVLEILDIFGGLMVDAGPELTYKEKMRITPHPLVFVHQFKPIPVKCI